MPPAVQTAPPAMVAGVPGGPASKPLAGAHVTYQRLLHADSEPQNWLTVSQNYSSWHYSGLKEITPRNVSRLKVAFMVALQVPAGLAVPQANQGTPLVVDGAMYVVGARGEVYRIDVSSGKRGAIQWIMDPQITGRPGSARGAAILGDTIYSTTPDGELIATNTATGDIQWRKTIRKVPRDWFTMPLMAVQNRILIGSAGSDIGNRGWLEARDAENGSILWTRYGVPAPGEPGSESWEGNSWKTGGGAFWGPGSYDPAHNLLVFGVGNPWPDSDPTKRPGDNLYTDSTIGIDFATGAVKWYFQYTPNDSWDYDEAGSQILIDERVGSGNRSVVAHAARNGFYYVIDRSNGQFIAGSQLVNRVTWTHGLNPKTGKPIEYDPSKRIQTYVPAARPLVNGGPSTVSDVCPQIQGGVNIFPQSYSPITGYTYAAGIEGCGSFGRGAKVDPLQLGSIVAADPRTGRIIHKTMLDYAAVGGTVVTAGGVVFCSTVEGTVYAFDAKSLKLLWQFNVGTNIEAAPISYAVNGKQYIALQVGGGALYSGPLFRLAAKGKDPLAMQYVQRSYGVVVFGL